MGGVDLVDQMMEYFRSWIRTKKWPVKVILHFFDLSIVNSWFEYRLDCDLKQIRKKDQMDLIEFTLNRRVSHCWTNKKAFHGTH